MRLSIRSKSSPRRLASLSLPLEINLEVLPTPFLTAFLSRPPTFLAALPTFLAPAFATSLPFVAAALPTFVATSPPFLATA